jgi:hypothetical protein
MAKKHKNLDNIPIKWDGKLSKPSDGSAQSSPDSVNLGFWGGYTPCWYNGYNDICAATSTCNYDNCVIEDMYFEDFNIVGRSKNDPEGTINMTDFNAWNMGGRTDIALIIIQIILGPDNEIEGGIPLPDKAPKKSYTWGDVSFIVEIADGIGTGNRRAREDRLQQLDKDTKKKLIHLICRVKGEKVYDEKKEVNGANMNIKLEDVDLVINEVLGKIKVEKADVL